MDIIRRISDNVVVFHGENLQLTADGAFNSKKICKAYTSTDYELLTIIEALPVDFISGGYIYDLGVFTITQAGLDNQAEQAILNAPTWDDVNALQNKMFEDRNLINRKSRYASQVLHKSLVPSKPNPKEASTIVAVLDYEENIRDANEDYGTPQEALDALNALELPAEPI